MKTIIEKLYKNHIKSYGNPGSQTMKSTSPAELGHLRVFHPTRRGAGHLRVGHIRGFRPILRGGGQRRVGHIRGFPGFIWMHFFYIYLVKRIFAPIYQIGYDLYLNLEQAWEHSCNTTLPHGVSSVLPAGPHGLCPHGPYAWARMGLGPYGPGRRWNLHGFTGKNTAFQDEYITFFSPEALVSPCGIDFSRRIFFRIRRIFLSPSLAPSDSSKFRSNVRNSGRTF